MPSKYRIDIDGDPKGIRNAAKQAVDALRGVGEAANKSADTRSKADRDAAKTAEREAKKAAQASFVSLLNLEKAAEKHADKLSAIAEKKRKKEEAEAKKAFNASFVSLQSLQSAGIAHVAKMEAQAKKLADAQAAQAKKSADAAAREAKRAADEVERSAESVKKAMFGSLDATNQLADVVGSLAGQFTLLGAAGLAIEAFRDYFRAVRQDIVESVKSLGDMREKTLELAALKGRLGQSTPEVAAQLAFRAETLQSEGDALRFQSSMLNTGASSIRDAQGNGIIAQGEFDKLMAKGGRFQAAQGGDADALGAFFGQLPTAMKQKDVTADKAFGEAAKVFNILDKGGSDLPVAVRQLSAGLGYTTSGIFDNVAQQASLQAAFSKMEPGKEQERTAQFTRATVGSLGRMRGAGVQADEKQAEYLKRIGATDQMNPIEIGKIIMADWAKQEAEAAKQGKKFNPITYMQGKGYGNVEDVNSLMQFSGLMKTGVWGTFESLANEAPNAAKVEGEIGRFQSVDPVAQQRKADLAEQSGTVARAAGPMEYYERLKRITFEKKKAQGEYYGNYEDWQGGMGFGKEMLENATASAMQEEAKRVGVRTGWGESLRMRPGFMANDRERAEAYYGVAQRIGEAGGDTMPGLKDLTDIARKQLESTMRTEKMMERSAPPGPPPLHGKPKGLNPRP